MPQNQLLLQSIKSFFVGGNTVMLENLPVKEQRMVGNGKSRKVDMNGTYNVGQMYVQEYKLAAPKCPYPVLLWHGGGMTGSQWEATPDGRDGWLWSFLQQGFNVYVSDAAERGRSSWLSNPDKPMPVPIFRSKEEAWSLFRIGPSDSYSGQAGQRVGFDGQQFPYEHFDDFTKQFVPRWIEREAMELRAYEAMLQAVGPCIVVGHSQGGGYAVQLAQKYPGIVRAVVALEATGMPDFSNEVTVPHLSVWGDYFSESPIWTDYRHTTDAYWTRLVGAGIQADILDLPQHQIKGNSHFCMLDRNSRQIADMAHEWLRSAI